MLLNTDGSYIEALAGIVTKTYTWNKYSLYWKAQAVKLKTNRNRLVTVYKKIEEPHQIIINDNSVVLNEAPHELKAQINKLDIISNCFGYTLLKGKYWVDPILNYLIYKEYTVDIILEDDGYIKSKEPSPNSLVLFSKQSYFCHIAKTEDGLNWEGKNAIWGVEINKINELIKCYGTPVFYDSPY